MRAFTSVTAVWRKESPEISVTGNNEGTEFPGGNRNQIVHDTKNNIAANNLRANQWLRGKDNRLLKCLIIHQNSSGLLYKFRTITSYHSAFQNKFHGRAKNKERRNVFNSRTISL